MLNYLLRRFVSAIFTVLGVMLFIFFLFFQFTTPESIARNAMGEKAKKDVIEKWIEEKGYNDPRYVNWDAGFPRMFIDTQFSRYIKSMALFKFGVSDNDGEKIAFKLKMGIVPTVLMTIPILLFSLVISIFLSMFSAMFQKTYIDRFVVVSCVTAMSIVYFLYIIAGQFIFARVLKWYPVSGWSDYSITTFLILPVLIGVIASIGESTRFYRTIMIHEIHSDYIRTARAKGLGDIPILIKHMLRNAMLPIITRVVMLLPYLFTGSLLLESFFGIPGLGRLMVDAITNADFAMIKAGVYLSSLLYIVANVISDICYTVADPRVRLK